MQVTLNIDANLAGSVADVFAALSVDERKQLAMAVVEKFLAEPNAAERKAHEATVIQKMIDDNTEIYYSYGNNKRAATMKPEELLGTNEFKKRMEGYKSTRDVLIAEITNAACAQYRESVSKLVKEDPKIQAIKEAVLAEIRKDFPAYVHDALAAWFVEGMTSMKDGMMRAIMQTQSAESFQKRVTERLQLGGY